MSVRPFRLRGRSELDAVGEQLADALRTWCTAWLGPVEIDLDVHPVSLVELSPQRRGDLAQWTDVLVRVARDDGNDWLVLLCGMSEQRKMDALLRSQIDAGGNEGPDSDTGAALARKALESLLDAIATASSTTAPRYQEPEDPLPLQTMVNERGGAGLVELSIGEFGFSILYGDTFCAKAKRPGEAGIHGDIVGRESAIGSGVVQAQVQLGGSELTIAELAGLEVGDVIRLDSSVNDPLQVELVPAGEGVAEGFLCACDGSKAIQITA